MLLYGDLACLFRDTYSEPMQNGYLERFNRLYRESILDAYLFFDLDEVRQLTQEWMEEHNEKRIYVILNNLSSTINCLIYGVLTNILKYGKTLYLIP
jgi:transposase InsO family protein